MALGEALKASKVIFITAQDGLIYEGQLIRQMPVAALDQLLAKHRAGFHPSCLSKASHASNACRSGIQRVHVINGRVDEALLAEIFSNEGVGTLIYANEYEQIRRAKKKDIRNILHLTKESVASLRIDQADAGGDRGSNWPTITCSRSTATRWPV